MTNVTRQIGAIKACPHCGSPFDDSHDVYVSFNKFDHAWFSHGGPWAFPAYNKLGFCQSCGRYFRFSKAPYFGSSAKLAPDTPAPWVNPRHAVEQHEGWSLWRAIKALPPGDPLELELRVLFWWRVQVFGERQMRASREWGGTLGNAHRANVIALLSLLDVGTSNERVLKAEALRELGHFGRCTALLKKTPRGYGKVAAAIRRHAARRDDTIFRIPHTYTDLPSRDIEGQPEADNELDRARLWKLKSACKQCGGEVWEDNTYFACDGCDFQLERNHGGRLLKIAEVEKFLRTGRLPVVRRRSTATRSAPTHPGSLGDCPSCGSPVVELERSYRCINGNCAFACSRVWLFQEIGLEQFRKLLQTGRTDVLEGFISNRERKRFRAALVIKRDKSVGFDIVGGDCAG